MRATHSLAVVSVLFALSTSMTSSPAIAAPTYFTHIADSANTFLFATQFDHPSVNGRSDVRLIVTRLWNPNRDLLGVSNPLSYGIFRSPENNWQLRTQDRSNVPLGVAFNVLVLEPEDPAFTHFNTPSNVSSQRTLLDHPLTNGSSDRDLFVTYIENPDGAGGATPVNDHPVMVIDLYFAPATVWAVENRDFHGMTESGGFFVYVPDDANVVVHAAGENEGDVTDIDHLLTNGRPEAHLQLTHRRNPSILNSENPHPVSLFWNSSTDRWTIQNDDDAEIPSGARWNVLVADGIFADGFENGNTSAWSSIVQ